MFPSYRNQSVDLLCKSTDWLLGLISHWYSCMSWEIHRLHWFLMTVTYNCLLLFVHFITWTFMTWKNPVFFRKTKRFFLGRNFFAMDCLPYHATLSIILSLLLSETYIEDFHYLYCRLCKTSRVIYQRIANRNNSK